MLRNINNIPRISTLKLGIVGIPFESGQNKPGTSQGPAAIRNAGLLNAIKTKNLDIEDYGDVQLDQNADASTSNKIKRFAQCTLAAHATSTAVHNVLKKGRICCTLGGDHLIGLGTVHGHLLHSSNVALLWVDAHADINTNCTSGSGNMHGMPLSLLVSESQQYWTKPEELRWLKQVIEAKNIAYIGLRSVDLYERLLIDKLGITAFGMRDVERYGIDSVINMALAKIDPRGDRSLHVSFDIDALEPSEAPSTGTPVRGGLSLREGIHIMETVRERGNLKALDLVEVNPLIGTAGDVARTTDAALEIISAAFVGAREGIRDDDIINIPTI